MKKLTLFISILLILFIFKQENIANEAKEILNKDSFTISFTGDVMFDWGLRDVVKNFGEDYPFDLVREELKSSDYTFMNLETAVTKRENKVPYQLFWIKSDPEVLPALTNAGVDMVNLANNHVLDYYEDGLVDTISSLKANNLEYIGAGINAEEAYSMKVANINGNKVGFISFCHFYPQATWQAYDNKPGVTNGYDLESVVSKVKSERAKNKDVDYVIVYFHWGEEKESQPVYYQKEYAKRLIDEKLVDAIVGSHPHWLQGFEIYNGVPIAYSLGNFLFPDYVSGHSAETGIYQLTFDNGKISARFLPGVISKNQIHLLEGAEKKNLLEYLQSISFNVNIDDDGNIK